MKILPLIFVVSLLFSSAYSPHVAQESAELREASGLSERVVDLFKQGKFDEALPLAQQALQIRERLLPRTDPRISTSLGYLGDLYLSKRDYGKAKDTFNRLLKIQEERSGANDVDVAFTLDRLALLQAYDGDARKAEASYKRALALREKAFGLNSSQVAQTSFAMGQFYRGRRDYDLAESSYKRSLEIYGQLSGVKSPEFVRTGNAFVCLYYEGDKANVPAELAQIQKRFAPAEPPRDPLVQPVSNAKAIKLGRAEYPEVAKKRSVSGTVVLNVEIDETGRVVKASDMCDGNSELLAAATKAAMSSRFDPKMVGGKAVKAYKVMLYSFNFLGMRP